MSVLANPTVARVVARGMQWGMGRAARRTTTRARSRFPGHRATTEPLRIPSTPGPVTATIYRPARTDRTPPVYVNLHGGGYVMGVREQDDPVCRLLAVEAGVVVVNVDYALAPQHRFPQPPEQIHEILVWIAEHGSEHGWDGTRLVVGGQSAGGALAAAGARLALERGGPAISLQVLHYPPLDLTVPAGAKHSPLARPMLRPAGLTRRRRRRGRSHRYRTRSGHRGAQRHPGRGGTEIRPAARGRRGVARAPRGPRRRSRVRRRRRRQGALVVRMDRRAGTRRDCRRGTSVSGTPMTGPRRSGR